jgi:hypothetical protein
VGVAATRATHAARLEERKRKRGSQARKVEDILACGAVAGGPTCAGWGRSARESWPETAGIWEVVLHSLDAAETPRTRTREVLFHCFLLLLIHGALLLFLYGRFYCPRPFSLLLGQLGRPAAGPARKNRTRGFGAPGSHFYNGAGMRCARVATWRFLRAGTLKGDGPVMTGDGLVPFGTAGLAALSLRCRQPVKMPSVSSKR